MNGRNTRNEQPGATPHEMSVIGVEVKRIRLALVWKARCLGPPEPGIWRRKIEEFAESLAPKSTDLGFRTFRTKGFEREAGGIPTVSIATSLPRDGSFGQLARRGEAATPRTSDACAWIAATAKIRQLDIEKNVHLPRMIDSPSLARKKPA